MIDQETFTQRLKALTTAQKFVHPICEAYPPEAYRITTGPTPPFSSPSGTTMTSAEQVVNVTLSIADWLLNVE
jgi:hypothetical protein